jgi:large subunit ribosomal protein L9
MPIEVLLMADVKDVGVEGDVVKVAEGFARNYLIPKKLAAPVTEATRRRLAAMQKAREAQSAETLKQAKATAAAIAKQSYTIPVKVGAEDKMFGAVTAADLAAQLKQHGFEIDRHQIALEHPLKELGVYEVKVKLHPDVEGTMKVWVVEE